jgi:hypothetical protein
MSTGKSRLMNQTMGSLADRASQNKNVRVHLQSHVLHLTVRTDTRIHHDKILRLNKLGSRCEFPDTATRYHYSSWPTATSRQHRKFPAVNEQRDLYRKQKKVEQKNFDLSEYLILSPECFLCVTFKIGYGPFF